MMELHSCEIFGIELNFKPIKTKTKNVKITPSFTIAMFRSVRLVERKYPVGKLVARRCYTFHFLKLIRFKKKYYTAFGTDSDAVFCLKCLRCCGRVDCWEY